MATAIGNINVPTPTFTYGYDAAGNRTIKAVDGLQAIGDSNSFNSPVEGTHLYSYDKENRITKEILERKKQSKVVSRKHKTKNILKLQLIA